MKRLVVLATLIGLAVAGCTPETNPLPNQLATDQTLHVAIPYDIGVFEQFDPNQLSSSLDYSIGQNLFDGLYRMDDQLHVVPDLASQMPIVSQDRLTYTIPLRSDARFSNGNPVTASDVVYSWNRALDAGGPFASFSGYANVFQSIAGYADVAQAIASNKQPLPALAGLSQPDSHTVRIRFMTPVGDYFLTQLTLPGMWLVDQRVIQHSGDQLWWQQPGSLVGTGPFKMVTRVPGRSMTFAPVPNWWGGGPPLIKKIELDVVPDANSVLQGYTSGRYDLVGLGDYGPGAAGTRLASAISKDPSHASEVREFNYGRTEWLAFNVQTGPFSGDKGRLGRLALSQAIDRNELAQAVCASGMLCFPATGGLISRGLDGYLGDGSDTGLRFDVASARANLQGWDPSGSVRKQLTYIYLANSLFRNVANDLRRQWRRNLGIDVNLQGYDPETYFYDRVFGAYSLFRGSWSGDYNSPKDWYDNLFFGNAPTSASGYADPSFVAAVTQASNSAGPVALTSYQQADRMLLDQAIIDPLLYYVHTVVVKPYVQGFGANALYEYRWTEIKLLQH